MLVLAIDTATPAVTAGVVELPAAGQPVELASRVTVDPRAHVELLAEHVTAALADAGVAMPGLDAIVCGAGPGPFTGLRVGMVTAAALGHALELPVYGVCSLDAIALAAPPTGEPLLVATDARRREVYWARYDSGGRCMSSSASACAGRPGAGVPHEHRRRRTDGPHVQRPAELAARLDELGIGHLAGAGAKLYAELLPGRPIVPPDHPQVPAMVAAAAADLRSGRAPEPLTPLYLRRPDAVEPARPKPVTAGAR